MHTQLKEIIVKMAIIDELINYNDVSFSKDTFLMP